jgi:hypothetical protein
VQLDWATDALLDVRKQLALRIPRHEQAAPYMADGYARSSGREGVCRVVPGPGLLNAMSGLATAYACNSRVLCIAGQIPSPLIGAGLGMLHEVRGQSAILGSVTKRQGLARRPEEIPGPRGARVRVRVRQPGAGSPGRTSRRRRRAVWRRGASCRHWPIGSKAIGRASRAPRPCPACWRGAKPSGRFDVAQSQWMHGDRLRGLALSAAAGARALVALDGCLQSPVRFSPDSDRFFP